MFTPTGPITIRPAYADDELTIVRLAQLDSAAAPPPTPLLLADVDGELRAALSLQDGSAIADPFFPTADLLTLLRTHATATAPGRPSVRRWHGRLRLAFG